MAYTPQPEEDDEPITTNVELRKAQLRAGPDPLKGIEALPSEVRAFRQGQEDAINRQVMQERVAEIARRRQEIAARKQAEAETAQFNSQALAKFRGRGQKYYMDPATKRYVPEVEAGTGRELYEQTAWERAQNAKGLPQLQRRTRYGEIETRRPTLTRGSDPMDDSLYADLGDGESVPYMTIDEALKSPDVGLQKIAKGADRARKGEMRKQELAATSGAYEAAKIEREGAEARRGALAQRQNEIMAQMQAIPEGHPLRQRLTEEYSGLIAEDSKLEAELRPQGRIHAAYQAADATRKIVEAQAKIAAYDEMAEQLQERIASGGGTPRDEATLKAITDSRAAFQRGLEQAQKAVQPIAAPVAQPAAAPAGPQSNWLGDMAKRAGRSLVKMPGQLVEGAGTLADAFVRGAGVMAAAEDPHATEAQRQAAIQQAVETPTAGAATVAQVGRQMAETAAADYADPALGLVPDPARNREIFAQAADSVGSLAGAMVVPGGVVPKTIAGAVLNSQGQAEEARRKLAERGASPEAQDIEGMRQFVWNLPAGGLEALPWADVLKKFGGKGVMEAISDKFGRTALRRISGSLFGNAALEAGEEGLQQLWGNAAAIAGYDENRSLGEGVGNAMAVGGLMGGALGATTAGVREIGGRGEAPGTVPPPPGGPTDGTTNTQGPDGAPPADTVTPPVDMNAESRKATLDRIAAVAEQAAAMTPEQRAAAEAALVAELSGGGGVESPAAPVSGIPSPPASIKSAQESALAFGAPDPANRIPPARSAQDAAQAFIEQDWREAAYRENPLVADPERYANELRAELERLNSQWQERIADTSLEAERAARAEAIESELAAIERERQSQQGGELLRERLGYEGEPNAELMAQRRAEIERRRAEQRSRAEGAEDALSEAERVRRSQRGGKLLREDLARRSEEGGGTTADTPPSPTPNEPAPQAPPAAPAPAPAAPPPEAAQAPAGGVISDESQTEQDSSQRSNEGGATPANEAGEVAPPSQPEPAGEAPSETRFSDLTRYAEIQREWKALRDAGVSPEDPRIAALWRENEEIKNRHGGMPPSLGQEPAATQAVSGGDAQGKTGPASAVVNSPTQIAARIEELARQGLPALSIAARLRWDGGRENPAVTKEYVERVARKNGIALPMKGRGPDVVVTPTPSPEPPAVVTDITPKEATQGASAEKPSRLQQLLAKGIQRSIDESKGRAVLEEMEGAGRTPNDTVRDFWDRTYPALDKATQAKFERYIERETSFRPGDTIGTNPDGTPIVAKTWRDIYDSGGDSVSNLEGTERGLIALMETANRLHQNLNPLKSNAPETRLQQPDDQQQHSRASQRPAVQADEGEVRQGQGEQTGRGDSTVGGAEAEGVVQPEVAPTLRAKFAGVEFVKRGDKWYEEGGDGTPVDAKRAAVLEKRAKGETKADRAIAALQKAKVHKPGQVASADPFTLAYDAALELAIIAIRAGRATADVVRLATQRLKAKFPDATPEQVARLESAITTAMGRQAEKDATSRTDVSKVPQSLRAVGVPAEGITYDVRNQNERLKEARAIIDKDGAPAAEKKISDRSLAPDTRVAIAGELLAAKADELAKATTPETIAAITRDIQRITLAQQSGVSTESGQGVAMHNKIYQNIAVANMAEYVQNATRERRRKLGGEDSENAVSELAKEGPATEESAKAILERLKQKHTTKPARRVLTALEKQTKAIVDLKKSGALDDASLMDLAAKELGIKGADPQQLKRISDAADRYNNAKTPAEKARAQLDMAELVGLYRDGTPMNILSSMYTANILPGFTTQLANVEGTSLNMLANLGILAINNPKLIRPMLDSFKTSVPLGLGEAKSIWSTGRATRDFQDKTAGAGSVLASVDLARDYPKFGGKLPTVPIPEGARKTLNVGEKADVGTLTLRGIERIFRFMKAADATFYYPAREAMARVAATKLLAADYKGAELEQKVREFLHSTPQDFASARDQTKAEGWTDDIDIGRRIAEIIEERRQKTPDGKRVTKAAEQFGAESTFTQEPVGLAGVAYHALKYAVEEGKLGGVPILKPFALFLKTPANVFNEITNYTPLGNVRAEMGMRGPAYKGGERRNFSAEERAALHTKAIIGTTLMAALLAKALNDDEIDITAKGPSNSSQRNQMRDSGWIPYSVRIGDSRKSFLNTPLALPLAIVGHVADAVKYQKSKEDMVLENKIADALLKSPTTIFDMSFLTGMGDLLEAMKEGDMRRVSRTMGGAPANLGIPYNRLLQQIDQSFDTQRYKSNPVLESVPFARRAGTPQTDVQGRPQRYSPAQRISSPKSQDSVDRLLGDRNLYIPDVGDVKVGDAVLPDNLRNLYRKLSGQRIRVRLQAEAGALRAMTKEKAQERIEDIARDERAKVKRLPQFRMVGAMAAPRP